MTITRLTAFLLFALVAVYPVRPDTPESAKPLFTAPFEYENNRIRLTVEIAGVPLVMLLDSGASTTVLFSNMQKAMANLPTQGNKTVLFPALDERLPARKLMAVKATLNGNEFTLSDLVLLDDKADLRARLLLRYDGILGQEFFRKFTIAVDPAAKTLTLYPPGTDLRHLYRNEYPLYLQDNAPHIRFRSKMPWEKNPSMKEMLVDTGYPGAIVFWDSTHYRKAAKLTPGAYSNNAAIVGRASFMFGRLRFLRTPIYLGSHPPQQVGKRDGLIGAGILNRFSYAIDLAGERMWMLAYSEGGDYSRNIDGTFYPPNDDAFVFSDFAQKLSTGPKTTTRVN